MKATINSSFLCLKPVKSVTSFQWSQSRRTDETVFPDRPNIIWNLLAKWWTKQRPIQTKTRRTNGLWVHHDYPLLPTVEEPVDMFPCRNFPLPRELCKVGHLVLVWERNLIVSRRIWSLVHNWLLLWPQTKLLPHHFSYLYAPINLRLNYWHLLRGNRARCIGHHRKSDWVFTESSSAVEPMDLPTVAQ